MTDSDTITGLLITALENAWVTIRSKHPDVPEVVLTVGAGSTGGNELTLGHFAANRWVRGEYELHELFIGGEGLQRGADQVLGTLLHEAAHGIATTREIKDTSRQGRWHNERYRTLGEEVGLILTQHPKIGWSLTTVPERTLVLYREALEELTFALVAYRRREPGAVGGRKSNNNGLSAVCACGRRIRVSRTTFDAGPIYCGSCGETFDATDEPGNPGSVQIEFMPVSSH